MLKKQTLIVCNEFLTPSLKLPSFPVTLLYINLNTIFCEIFMISLSCFFTPRKEISLLQVAILTKMVLIFISIFYKKRN